MEGSQPHIIWFSDPESADVTKVGGKNASLGEMTQKLHGVGIAVPDGFAISVAAYWDFVEANGLQKRIAAALDEYKQGRQSLTEVGQAIRTEFLTEGLTHEKGMRFEARAADPTEAEQRLKMEVEAAFVWAASASG